MHVGLDSGSNRAPCGFLSQENSAERKDKILPRQAKLGHSILGNKNSPTGILTVSQLVTDV